MLHYCVYSWPEKYFCFDKISVKNKSCLQFYLFNDWENFLQTSFYFCTFKTLFCPYCPTASGCNTTSSLVPWCHITKWVDIVDCKNTPGNHSYTGMSSNNLPSHKNSSKPHNTTKLKLNASPARLLLLKTPKDAMSTPTSSDTVGYGQQNDDPTKMSMS